VPIEAKSVWRTVGGSVSNQRQLPPVRSAGINSTQGLVDGERVRKERSLRGEAIEGEQGDPSKGDGVGTGQRSIEELARPLVKRRILVDCVQQDVRIDELQGDRFILRMSSSSSRSVAS
jgi:hypothetical protein